jgi:hypothetical protein
MYAWSFQAFVELKRAIYLTVPSITYIGLLSFA